MSDELIAVIFVMTIGALVALVALYVSISSMRNLGMKFSECFAFATLFCLSVFQLFLTICIVHDFTLNRGSNLKHYICSHYMEEIHLIDRRAINCDE